MIAVRHVISTKTGNAIWISASLSKKTTVVNSIQGDEVGMIMINIEMPEKCGECPCFHAEYPMHCQLIKPPDKNKRLAAPYGLPRPDWCPLLNVEVIHNNFTKKASLKK